MPERGDVETIAQFLSDCEETDGMALGDVREALARIVAHAEALEASREAVIAQRDDNWRRLCEANTRAEALEAERDALLDFMEDWRDRLEAARRAALTGPGEGKR